VKSHKFSQNRFLATVMTICQPESNQDKNFCNVSNWRQFPPPQALLKAGKSGII